MHNPSKNEHLDGKYIYWQQKNAFGRTAEQQLLSSVRERQVLDGCEAASHGSAQVTRVAQRPNRQAVQVNRLQQVGQERPLQAHNAPPAEAWQLFDGISAVKISIQGPFMFDRSLTV